MGRWTPHWTGVMIHHSAGPDSANLDTEAIRRYHVDERGWDDIGYHYVVERVQGSHHAIAGRPLTKWGAHCPGYNGSHIGVCLVGDFTDHPPPQEQLEVAADLVAGLLWTIYSHLDAEELDDLVAALLSDGALSFHRDHRATACPGDAFPEQQFREMVRSRLEAA